MVIYCLIKWKQIIDGFDLILKNSYQNMNSYGFPKEVLYKKHSIISWHLIVIQYIVFWTSNFEYFELLYVKINIFFSHQLRLPYLIFGVCCDYEFSRLRFQTDKTISHMIWPGLVWTSDVLLVGWDWVWGICGVVVTRDEWRFSFMCGGGASPLLEKRHNILIEAGLKKWMVVSNMGWINVRLWQVISTNQLPILIAEGGPGIEWVGTECGLFHHYLYLYKFIDFTVRGKSVKEVDDGEWIRLVFTLCRKLLRSHVLCLMAGGLMVLGMGTSGRCIWFTDWD